MPPDEANKKAVLDLDDPCSDADESLERSGVVGQPTVPPPFDLAQFAQQATKIRDRASTIGDEDLTEQARLASVLMDSTPPPSARARLEPLDRVPSLLKAVTELGDAVGEPKTAYVLGFVDGLLPLETILEVAGLPEEDTVEILARFIESGVIVFRAR